MIWWCFFLLVFQIISLICVDLLVWWWFQICFCFLIFSPIWGDDPIWLIFFETGWNHQLVFVQSKKIPMKWLMSTIFLDKVMSTDLGGDVPEHLVKSWPIARRNEMVMFFLEEGWNIVMSTSDVALQKDRTLGEDSAFHDLDFFHPDSEMDPPRCHFPKHLSSEKNPGCLGYIGD